MHSLLGTGVHANKSRVVDIGGDEHIGLDLR